jgi:methylenetetrahydrofolate dehydrogenase (NADP+)/methenyltetrahydrofolate cyclohydrolase
MQTTMTMMDGKAVAEKVLEGSASRVRQVKARTGVTPCLAAVIVGDDPASVTYVKMKRRRCEAVGMRSMVVEMPGSTTTAGLVAEMGRLSEDRSVHGILLQHPVPQAIDERAAFEAIAPEKDVDGVTIHSFGTVSFGLSGFGSCTPAGIMRLLEAYRLPIAGKHAVVIGRSPILGKPMAMMLLAEDATVTICHSKTQGLAEVVRQGDIVVAAVGKPRFVRGDWVKRGAVVIDAGYNPGNVGDVDFESAAARASMITPVPGGVGPMTIAMLLDQTSIAAARQLGLKGLE